MRVIHEQRPGIQEGSIHCPVRCMRDVIASKHLPTIAKMIKQLRAAYADETAPDYIRGGYLWLGRRYQKAYTELTGSPLPKEKKS